MGYKSNAYIYTHIHIYMLLFRTPKFFRKYT